MTLRLLECQNGVAINRIQPNACGLLFFVSLYTTSDDTVCVCTCMYVCQWRNPHWSIPVNEQVALCRAVLRILGALGTNSNLKHNLIKLGYASPQSLFESLRVMHCICICVTSFYKCINIEINCINININM